MCLLGVPAVLLVTADKCIDLPLLPEQNLSQMQPVCLCSNEYAAQLQPVFYKLCYLHTSVLSPLHSNFLPLAFPLLTPVCG